MSYLDGYEFDIFVSYARDNNAPNVGEKIGWVTHFYTQFEKCLRDMLKGRERLKIFFDDYQNNFTTDDFIDKVSKSAIIIVIGSPAYFDENHFSVAELNAFMATAASADRVFVVEYLPLDNEASYPSSVRTVLRKPFYERVEGSVRPLFVTETDKFWGRIWDMANLVKARIDRFLSPRASSQIAQVTKTNAKTVLMAQVTGDLVEERYQVVRYLEQFGVTVLPSRDYPADGQAFHRAFVDDLNATDIFVQLLGPLGGTALPGMDRSPTQYQYEQAIQRGKTIFQWRKPGFNPADIRDSKYRNMVVGESVLACGLEEFKGQLKTSATAVDKQQRARRSSLVFINVDQRDVELGRAFQRACNDFNVTTALPIFDGSAADAPAKTSRSDLEENLIDCEVLVLMCNNAPTDWVRGQLRNFSKIKAHRESEPRIFAIFIEGQSPKPSLNMNIPFMNEIRVPDSQGGDLRALAQRVLG